MTNVQINKIDAVIGEDTINNHEGEWYDSTDSEAGLFMELAPGTYTITIVDELNIMNSLGSGHYLAHVTDDAVLFCKL